MIDTIEKKLVLTIPVSAGPRRVAMAPDGHYAYTVNTGSGNVIDTAIKTVILTFRLALVAPDGNQNSAAWRLRVHSLRRTHIQVGDSESSNARRLSTSVAGSGRVQEICRSAVKDQGGSHSHHSFSERPTPAASTSCTPSQVAVGWNPRFGAILILFPSYRRRAKGSSSVRR